MRASFSSQSETTTVSVLSVPDFKSDSQSPYMMALAEAVGSLSSKPEIYNADSGTLSAAVSENIVSRNAPAIAALTSLDHTQSISPTSSTPASKPPGSRSK